MHFELIFYKVWGMGGVLLHCIWLSQHRVLKRQACISESPLYLCQKSIGHVAYGSISGLCILFHWSLWVFLFPPVSHWLHCSSFTGSLEIRLCAKSSFFLLNHFLLSTSYLEITLDWENRRNSTGRAPKPFTRLPSHQHLIEPQRVC